jgi:hypothetical protein
MLFIDYSVGNGKPLPRTYTNGFGGEKWIKNFLHGAFRHAATIIGYLNVGITPRPVVF